VAGTISRSCRMAGFHNSQAKPSSSATTMSIFLLLLLFPLFGGRCLNLIHPPWTLLVFKFQFRTSDTSCHVSPSFKNIFTSHSDTTLLSVLYHMCPDVIFTYSFVCVVCVPFMHLVHCLLWFVFVSRVVSLMDHLPVDSTRQ